MTKVYIDCNILIDWLVDREPFSFYASKIIELTEKRRIESYVSALTLANTYYLVSKELNKRIANEFLKDSIALFQFAYMPESIIKGAIENNYKDFEDDLHYFTALEYNLDYLITRNKKDFRGENITIIDAENFMRLQENVG